MTEPTASVLVVGKLAAVVEDAVRGLPVSDIEVVTATDIDGVGAAFSRRIPEHVIMGAGLELQTRLDIVREIFSRSETTTVHMKDSASGPEGFPAFVESIIRALV